jgi:hypothetical protein
VNDTSARKFAKYVFEEHRAAGTFEIEVADSDLFAVVAALEELGCEVQTDQFRPRLTVICPTPVPTA